MSEVETPVKSENDVQENEPVTETQSAGSSEAAPSPAKTTAIEITDKALIEIRRIIQNDPSAHGCMLRVMVVGGGCSGMSYKLGFDKQPPATTDKVFEREGVQVIIDAKSFLFLAGTVLDFTDGLNGTGFVFQNPNAKRSCGCGSSFAV